MILACNNIKKSFGIDEILTNVNFQLNENDKVALVGVNGAGKSTLFKIITGEFSKDSGAIITPSNISIGYLSQNIDLSSDNTIYDEMLTVFQYIIDLEKKLRDLEYKMKESTNTNSSILMDQYSKFQEEFDNSNGYGYKSSINGVLKGLGFTEAEFNQRISQLSGGQKTRIALAKLLLNKPDILLLDEPTNHLDIEAIQWLEDFLNKYKGTLIIISHDRYFLDKIVNKVIEIENGSSTAYTGSYTEFASKKLIDNELHLKHYMDQQKEIKKQEEVIRQLKSFNREKSVKRARSREKLLDKVERIDKPIEIDSEMRLCLNPKIQSGNDVIIFDNVKKSFDNVPLFQNINLHIKKGNKVALIGGNGTGKTTLFRILMNQTNKDSGKIIVGSNVNIGYYDQEHANLSLQKTLFDEISDAYPNMTNTEIRNVLASFLFTGDDVYKKISSLSGGEKGRLSLAKIMLSEANLLLLDEPTNHLDMISKEILEKAINSYTGTVLYISHDRYFINKTTDKILELKKTGLKTYLGNYDNYLEKKSEEKSVVNHKSTIIEKENTTSKEDWLKNKEAIALERKKLNEIENLENNISDVEEKIQEIENKLCLEEVYTDPIKAQDFHTEKIKYESLLEGLYEKWELIN